MRPHPRILAAVQAVNAIGFLAYLVWLATSHERIMNSREGVLFLLPCVAFLFVFACLRAARHRELEAAADAKEDAWNAVHKP